MFDFIKPGHPLYNILRRPATIAPQSNMWVVYVEAKDGSAWGFIWCPNSTDAYQVYDMVMVTNLFRNVRVSKWTERD